MIDVLAYLPVRKKTTASGWISFNAVCCTHNGQSQDKRGRGGIKATDQGWSYHCFNCGYTASFTLGRNLSIKARRLLNWLNVPEADIDRINLESLRHRSIEGQLLERKRTMELLSGISFKKYDLPEGAEVITPEYTDYWNYLESRAVPMDYPYMTVSGAKSPTNTLMPGRKRRGIIIPFTYDDVIVGFTTRFLDEHNPRYLHAMQTGYVFGTDLQQDNWEYVIVCEGVFDALSISGLGLLHNEISEQQARIIRNLERQVIVVPDQDVAGLKLIDDAVRYNFAVSIPPWPKDVKDVNDAVKKFGRIGTLLTILENKETSRVKIELRKKQLAKRIQR